MLLHLSRMEGNGLEPRVNDRWVLAGYGAEAMREAIASPIGRLPVQLRRKAGTRRRTVTCDQRRMPPPEPGRARSGASASPQHPVRIDDVLTRGTLVEFAVGLRRLGQRDNGGVDRLGDMNFVMEDRPHQPDVVLHDRTLPRGK
jgi:hypothetical protein